MRSADWATRTFEGTSFPIVLFAELIGDRAKAWARELEDAFMIVLYEASLLRASIVIGSERPHVVVLASTVAPERTQAVRDAARDVGAEVLALPLDMPPAQMRSLVERAVTEALGRRSAR